MIKESTKNTGILSVSLVGLVWFGFSNSYLNHMKKITTKVEISRLHFAFCDSIVGTYKNYKFWYIQIQIGNLTGAMETKTMKKI